jgi:hypothetical protein
MSRYYLPLPRPKHPLKRGYKKHESTIYLEIEDTEIEFTLTSHIWPGNKARVNCPIEKSEPAEPPEIEHQDIRAKDVILTPEEFTELAEASGERHFCLDEIAVVSYCNWVECMEG